VLRTRLLTAIVLIPIVVGLIYLGDLPFLVLVAGLATLAEVEFCLLVTRHGFQPIHVSGIALVWLFLLDAQVPSWQLMRPGTAAVLFGSLVWQVVRHKHLRVTDWTGPIATGTYLGLYAAYLIRLRSLPGDGLWWTLVAVPAILLADSAAYFAGSAWGRHKLAPSVSPGKTWEGYGSGIIVGSLMGAFFAWLWAFRAGPGSTLSASRGLALGLLISAVAPMGDLAVSVVKREAGVNDSGKVLPGHGGALDRLDSVLWSAVIGYYYVIWVVR